MGRTALLACPEGGTSLSAMAGLDRSSFNTEPGLRSISFSLLCFCAVCCYAGSFFVAASKKANVLALSVSARGKSFLKRRGLGMTAKFLFKVQSAWFRQRLSLWESWHRAAMAERASPLTEMQPHSILLHAKRTVARCFVQRFFLNSSLSSRCRQGWRPARWKRHCTASLRSALPAPAWAG